METPLFGEESPRDKAIQYIVGGLLVIGVILTLIFAFVNGVQKDPIHIVMGVTVVFLLVVLIVLWRWYRVGDLDPKFKYLIGGIIFNIVLLIVVANVYFWEQTPMQICASGFYEVTTGLCYQGCPQDACLDIRNGAPGECVANCTSQQPPTPTVTRSPFIL